jgi:AcrR family transcriptional regulator
MSSKTKPEPRRQGRGRQRMEDLLRAAEEVFAEVGYDRATTNLIAAHASVSPGTLYQFYPNKEALAEALAARYAGELEKLHARVFDAVQARVPLPELVDAMVDPFLGFHRAAPAFEALFLAAIASPELSKRVHVLHDTVASRLVTVLERQAPAADHEDLLWAAETAVGVFRGLLPVIASAKPARRRRAVQELKTVLSRYLEPLLSQ